MTPRLIHRILVSLAVVSVAAASMGAIMRIPPAGQSPSPENREITEATNVIAKPVVVDSDGKVKSANEKWGEDWSKDLLKLHKELNPDNDNTTVNGDVKLLEKWIYAIINDNVDLEKELRKKPSFKDIPNYTEIAISLIEALGGSEVAFDKLQTKRYEVENYTIPPATPNVEKEEDETFTIEGYKFARIPGTGDTPPFWITVEEVAHGTYDNRNHGAKEIGNVKAALSSAGLTTDWNVRRPTVKEWQDALAEPKGENLDLKDFDAGHGEVLDDGKIIGVDSKSKNIFDSGSGHIRPDHYEITNINSALSISKRRDLTKIIKVTIEVEIDRLGQTTQTRKNPSPVYTETVFATRIVIAPPEPSAD